MSSWNMVESSTIRPRVRLTKEGVAFLSDYVRTVSPYPHMTEKKGILAHLHAIPGNEAYTLEKLSSWFARNRKLSRDPHAPVLVDDETILFPKLTSIHLQQLRVLYRKRADPLEGIVTFWADRINADRAEVAAWIQYQQEKAKANDVGASPDSPDTSVISPTTSEFPCPHLPTPAKSLSPSISPQIRAPSLPPITVKVEESRKFILPVLSSGTPPLQPGPVGSNTHPNEPQGLTPFSSQEQLPVRREKPSPVATSDPSVLSRIDGEPFWWDSNTILATTIRDSLHPDAITNGQPPRTADEFTEKFQEVENIIYAFMKKYDGGQLVWLGWDPRVES